MKNAVTINSRLFKRVKAAAARSGITIREFVEAAISSALSHRKALTSPQRIRLIRSHSKPGLSPAISLDDHAGLLDAMDEPNVYR